MLTSFPRKLAPAGVKIYLTDLFYSLFGCLFFNDSQNRLADKISTMFNVKYCFTIISGRAGLSLILRCLMDIDLRRELIVPGYTCFSIPSSIRRAGLKMRIVDFSSNSFEYDYTMLKKSIIDDTLGILLVYPFCLSVNINRIKKLAKQRKVYLIEDAAQAMGLRINGQYAGTIGDVGFFSLGKGKTITSIKGGLVITNNETIGKNLDKMIKALPEANFLKNINILASALFMKIFINPYLYWFVNNLRFIKLGETSYNTRFKIAKMPKIAALLARRMIQRLDKTNQERKTKADKYIKELGNCQGISIIQGYNKAESLYLRMPILVGNINLRNRILRLLNHHGVSKMYQRLLEAIDDPSLFTNNTESCPNANNISKFLLTFPTHFKTTTADIKIISSLIQKAITGFERSNEKD